MDTFPAVVVAGPGPAELRQLGEADLPAEPLLVEVAYSSLNYKDGLAVTGRGRVVRNFPMTLGIDLAGTVLACADGSFATGSEVLVTGWGLGETHPGGYTTRQRVRPQWALPLPPGLDARRAMAFGTAGLTAMLCVTELERGGVTPEAEGDVLVTGASGGVGSVAIALLARRGFRVVASTGRAELEGYLTGLGAAEVVERAELARAPQRPLAHERWAGVVDTVGSTTLASALAGTCYGGTVTACGLAGGSDLPATVLPFILRSVRLVGVDSVSCPAPKRAGAWRRLAEIPAELLDSLHEVRPMSAIHELGEAVLAGAVRGRVVIDPRS